MERLVREFGTLDRVAELGKTSPVYLSQIRAASLDHRGTVRAMGTLVARKLEEGCSKEVGWMDTPSPAMLAAAGPPYGQPADPYTALTPAQIAAGMNVVSKAVAAPPVPSPPMPHGKVVAWSEPSDLSDEWVIVERRSIKLSAGNGTIVIEHEQLPPLAFREEYLRSKRVRNRSNLVVCYAEGTSMEPAFTDGDVLLCDIGQTEVVDGEVYALDYGGELRVKRLRKRFDGGLLIQSDNAVKFPPEALDAAQALHIKILGRVLWRGGSV